jgi:hypothetical protein
VRIAVEENLLGHLLKANDSETTLEVEQRLASDPSAIHDLALLRTALAPLEADREGIEPPADLWVRTLSRVAEHMVATEGGVANADAARTEELIGRAAAMATEPVQPPWIRPSVPDSDASLVTPRRRNLIAIIGLTASVLALLLPAVIHLKQRSDRIACQNGMEQFYKAAAGYSDQNEGQFPKVEDGKTASTAAQALKDAGYLPPDQRFVCPAARVDASGPSTLVNYAYSLGFRDEAGELRGLDRRPDTNYMPILADAPIRKDKMALPGNHRHGHNVLFAGGQVRFCTNPNVGIAGDDIFFNNQGEVGAGLTSIDTVLGGPEERP